MHIKIDQGRLVRGQGREVEDWPEVPVLLQSQGGGLVSVGFFNVETIVHQMSLFTISVLLVSVVAKVSCIISQCCSQSFLYY